MKYYKHTHCQEELGGLLRSACTVKKENNDKETKDGRFAQKPTCHLHLLYSIFYHLKYPIAILHFVPTLDSAPDHRSI